MNVRRGFFAVTYVLLFLADVGRWWPLALAPRSFVPRGVALAIASCDFCFRLVGAVAPLWRNVWQKAAAEATDLVARCL